MLRRLIPILLLGLAAVSCEKVKNFAGQAQSKILGESASAASKPAPELQKLVDQTTDGVVFRKDLPFPAHLEVKTTCRREIAGRVFESSAVETHAVEMKGTLLTVSKLVRNGADVSYTLEESSFSVPNPDGSDKPDPKAAPKPPALPGTHDTFRYRKTGNTWQSTDGNSFRAASLAKTVTPVLDQLLIENAAASRTMWIGKRRFKSGDELKISNETLPMLITGKGSGSFTLVFQSTEAVAGHPCGVFTIKGSYGSKQQPDFDGNLTDSDVSIESGKIWLSLLYPIILRQELETIQSNRTGGQGGFLQREQGKVKISLTREWKSK